MAQESIELNTTPPYSGASLVADLNGALQAIATDFAGPDDPVSLGGVGAYMTWADTGNSLFKRRNAANTEWVIEGVLFKQSPTVYAEADIPTVDVGPIYVIGKGAYEWDGVSAYAPALISYDPTGSGLPPEINNISAAIDETYNKYNIVGAVSESSGTPSGAIIERGSNATGEWVRYADGTQICWRSGTTSTTINSLYTTGLYVGDITVTLPVVFVGTVAGLTGEARWGSGRSWVTGMAVTSGDQARINFMDSVSRASGTVAYNFAVIGRWY